MPQIYTALASEVKVNEETIEGLQSIDYTFARNRQHIGAIGTDERIAVYFGLKTIVGKLRVASANITLDKLLQSNGSFDISATLKHGETQRSVGFLSCYMEDKAFGLGSEGHAETVYSFTATRLKED
jgi:hypothetical protein